MHDIRAIRADPEAFDAALARRGMAGQAAHILDPDNRRRNLLQKHQEWQSNTNNISKAIGVAIRSGKIEAADTLKAQLPSPPDKDELQELVDLEDRIKTILDALPNILDGAVPSGRDESDNVVVGQHGEPRDLGFEPKPHYELGEALGLMDFSTAAKLAGARFTVLRGGLARLERALGQFMIDLHTDTHGYTEMAVPSLVNKATAYGTGNLPKFEDDLFKTTDGRYLIPTAEMPLTNTVAGDILADTALPMRLTALTDCFRSEAGSAGRDTRGMLRQHQFRKVELVSITHPNSSGAEHERMTAAAERVLTLLELPFRRVLLCAGDTGFAAAKTFDLEVWMPGQQAWREISSCSNCHDFQARRMNARFREGKAVAFVHTLNGSGVAIGRALIAVMENHQQADGSILIPAALVPYMGGIESIK